MDPDLDPTYPHPHPHPHHCHLVNPLADPFHSPLVLIPPLFEVDPGNPMQRTVGENPTGSNQPQTSTSTTAHSQSESHVADRVAEESAQSHDPQTQRRLDARDQDARMAHLAKEQYELDRQQQQMHENKKKNQQDVKATEKEPFIRDVSAAWAEAQRHAALTNADDSEGKVQRQT